MNEFGKICVVFVTAASLAFVAFAGAMRNGGRNWTAEAAEIADDFPLTITAGEKGNTYAITDRRKGAPVGSPTPILAEAVTAGKTKQIANAREEQTRLTEETAKYAPRIDEANLFSVADEKGLALRADALTKQLDDVAAEITRVNTQIVDAANEAQRIRSTGQERREEGYRLRNQLELLRNDLFAAQAQRKNLVEEEIRLQETLRRLKRRHQQLSGNSESDNAAGG